MEGPADDHDRPISKRRRVDDVAEEMAGDGWGRGEDRAGDEIDERNGQRHGCPNSQSV